MKKKLLATIGLSLLSVGLSWAVTSVFETPLSFEQKPRTYVHYPFTWLNGDCCETNCTIDFFGVYYQRNACCAFGCGTDCTPLTSCENSCNKVTSNTIPLAQLWFGKSSFTVADAFEGGEVSGPVDNPFVLFTTLKPQLGYNERGAFIGATVNRFNLGCNGDWFVSARIGLPISIVEVNQRSVNNSGSIDPDFVNTITTIQQQFNGGDDASKGSLDGRDVRAYRLDLLTSLKLPNGDPMVVFGTASSNTTVAGQDITINTNQLSQASTGINAPMYVYKQSSGIIPITPAGQDANSTFPTADFQNLLIAQSPDGVLQANGTQIAPGGVGPVVTMADGQWASFNGLPNPGAGSAQVNYAGGLGANKSIQKQLFLVPVGSSSSVSFEPIGLTVQNIIDRVIEDLQLSGANPISFLAEQGIDFGRSDCTTGAGDLFMDIWGGKQNDCWFADGLFGLRVPTGTKTSCPQRIFAQPNGSNGHFGIRLGLEGGYMLRNWLGLKAEVFWTHFCKARERRAATFTGSNIRNIGPCVDADVSWNSVVLYLDATFFSRCCPDAGWDFGYEFYARSKDKLCYAVTQIADFAGSVKTLDACAGAFGSNTQSHKLRAEFFNRWGCFQIFFGGSYIVAGRYVMKETEWHLGVKADF